MDSAVIAAIISGSVAVVSPITTYLITRTYDRRLLGKLEGRRKALLGSWKGTIVQDTNKELGPMNIDMTFTSSGKVVEGNCELLYPVGNQLTKLKFTGGFYHEQFVKFDYTNPDESVVQFGSAVRTLAPSGKTLEGRYVGYGSLTNMIVSGVVVMHRTAEQFNGREGETATLLSRCPLNFSLRGGGFAPRHLNRSTATYSPAKRNLCYASRSNL